MGGGGGGGEGGAPRMNREISTRRAASARTPPPLPPGNVLFDARREPEARRSDDIIDSIWTVIWVIFDTAALTVAWRVAVAVGGQR